MSHLSDGWQRVPRSKEALADRAGIGVVLMFRRPFIRLRRLIILVTVMMRTAMVRRYVPLSFTVILTAMMPNMHPSGRVAH